MAIGLVKWFNDLKGYGFIEPEGGGEDIFVHFSAIHMNGFKTLRQGARVSFELTDGPKGKQALNIQPEEGNERRPRRSPYGMLQPHHNAPHTSNVFAHALPHAQNHEQQNMHYAAPSHAASEAAASR